MDITSLWDEILVAKAPRFYYNVNHTILANIIVEVGHMNAQESFEWYIKLLLKEIEKSREHTKRVVALCEEFADKYPDAVDRELLLDAAWLHDIAKYRADKKHNDPEKVLKLLKKYELGSDIDDIEAVADVIAVHKGEFAPWDNELESAVLRLCDKLDGFEKGKENAEEKCYDTLKKIKKSGTLGKSKCKKLRAFFEHKLRIKKVHILLRRYRLTPTPSAPGSAYRSF